MSRVAGLRTIRISERPNLIWVELETDEGLCGLGESFRGAQAVEAVLHEQVAPWLIGRDARRIEAVLRPLLAPPPGFHGAIGVGDAAVGPYDDQVAFMRDAGALAESLLAEGYTAMKIWPLDPLAEAS